MLLLPPGTQRSRPRCRDVGYDDLACRKSTYIKALVAMHSGDTATACVAGMLFAQRKCNTCTKRMDGNRMVVTKTFLKLPGGGMEPIHTACAKQANKRKKSERTVSSRK